VITWRKGARRATGVVKGGLERCDGCRMQEEGLWADVLNRHLQVLLGIYLHLRYVCLVLTPPVVCVAGQTGIGWLGYVPVL